MARHAMTQAAWLRLALVTAIAAMLAVSIAAAPSRWTALTLGALTAAWLAAPVIRSPLETLLVTPGVWSALTWLSWSVGSAPPLLVPLVSAAGVVAWRDPAFEGGSRRWLALSLLGGVGMLLPRPISDGVPAVLWTVLALGGSLTALLTMPTDAWPPADPPSIAPWAWLGPALTLVASTTEDFPVVIPLMAAGALLLAAGAGAPSPARPPAPAAAARALPAGGAPDRERRVVTVLLRLLHDLRQTIRILRTAADPTILERADHLDRLATMAIRYLVERTLPTPTMQPVALEPLVRQVVADWSAAAQRVAVRLVVMARPVAAVGDAMAVRRVLDNLMANAVRAAAPGGAVTVLVDTAVTSARCDAVIEVRDTGCGIPPDLLPHIFQPFVSGAPSQGQGLGLTIVADLVEMMHGHISVSSVPGIGSVFTVHLPAVASAETHARIAAAEEDADACGESAPSPGNHRPGDHPDERVERVRAVGESPGCRAAPGPPRRDLASDPERAGP
jgi:signal transduction histidine kinase